MTHLPSIAASTVTQPSASAAENRCREGRTALHANARKTTGGIGRRRRQSPVMGSDIHGAIECWATSGSQSGWTTGGVVSVQWGRDQNHIGRQWA